MKQPKPEFKISYHLWTQRIDREKRMPLYIRSSQNSDKPISYNTGIKLTAGEWSSKTRQPKNKSAAVMSLERKLTDTYRDLYSQGQAPTLSDLIKNLDSIKRPTGTSVVEWCDDYIRGEYSDGQKKAVRTLKANITGHNDALTFEQLTKPRLKAFFDYLTKKKVANNSQYKRLRALVNVANHANIDCPALINYEMPYSTLNAIKVRLNWAEVKKVMTTETNSGIESVAKDVFLIACFSGLRISDILSLHRGKVHDYHYERLQTKTKTPVMVTLHKYNDALFRKYISTGVPYSRQKLSKALKEVLKRSGMDEEVVRLQQVGHKHKETVKPKFKEVAFHSGRRFYARLLNDLGLGNEIARDELGHGFRSVTELYAGSPEHMHRVARVRKAMDTMEETLKELALMKVA